MPEPDPRPGRRRVLAFAVIAAACVVVAVGAVVMSARSTASDPSADAGARVPSCDPALVFTSLDRSDPDRYGALAVADPDAPEEGRAVGGMICERVYFSAGTGVCLARTGRVPLTYGAKIFDADLNVRRTVDLPGLPSRARVSRDGRWVATTTFVSGDSYADPGAFSTRETIIEADTGRTLPDLEQWPVFDGDAQVDAADHNIWGVTFAPDGDTFYATLGTRGGTHLVQGSLSEETLRILRDDVECPSLSPDGTRIAFKKRVGEAGMWRLTVLDLGTMTETPLAEEHSVDDQAEWLDDRTVLYGVDEEIRAVPADGTGAPVTYLAGASSPAVVRG